MNNLRAAPRGGGGRAPKTSDEAFEDYEVLRVELNNSGLLWEDPNFKADDSSLFPNGTKPASWVKSIEWKRPGDLVESPHLFTDGMSRFDIEQGEIGDCWFLAAVASLSMNEDLMSRVVPEDQGFEKRRYCGAFKFRFWRFGDWQEVIVDDRLPTRNGKLVFMHSKENNEFWSALLEKAYAKVNGSYENLTGGSQAEAMEDFTGGLCETFALETVNRENFFNIVMKNTLRKSLMGCALELDAAIESILPNGLVVGHAYSVTGASRVLAGGKKYNLIRIRNPWGQSEWKGPWSDDSRELKMLSAQQKADMGLVNDDDGEFWMEIGDFLDNFTKLEVCHLSPEDEDDIDEDLVPKKDQKPGLKKLKRRWEQCLEVGNWTKNVSAGGCRNYIKSFASNPQFKVEVVDPDEEDDEDKGTLIIGLMQKDVRRRGLEFSTIGYSIYKLKDPKCGRVDMQYIKFNKMVARSPQFVNTREICGRHKLDPGHYVIIPSTFKPGEEGAFLLRIFSEQKSMSGEMDEQISYVPQPEPTLALPKADRKTLETMFKNFSGPVEAIHAYQLLKLLNETIRKELRNFTEFDAEVCRSLVSLYDLDQTGKLEFGEFEKLWADLRMWKAIFQKCDADESGSFDVFELRQTLSCMGYTLSNRLYEVIALRYCDPEKGIVDFEDFLLLIVRLRCAFENFNAMGPKEDNSAVFGLGAFLQMSMYV